MWAKKILLLFSILVLVACGQKKETELKKKEFQNLYITYAKTATEHFLSNKSDYKEYALKSIEAAKHLHDSFQVDALILAGDLFVREVTNESLMDSSLLFLDQADKIATRYENVVSMRDRRKKTLLLKAVYYSIHRKDDSSLHNLVMAKGIQSSGQQNDKYVEFQIIRLLGQIYESHDTSRVLENLQELLINAKELGDSIELTDAYKDLGRYYNKLGLYNLSITYLDSAEVLSPTSRTQIEAKHSISVIKALDYYSLENYPSAHFYSQRALFYARQFGDEENIAAATGVLAHSLYKLGNKDSAKILINDLLKFSENSPAYVQINALYEASDLYELAGEYKKSLSTFKRMIELKDSLQAKTEEETIDQLTVQYQVVKRDNLIAAQKNLVTRQRFYVFSAIVLASLFALTILFLIQRYRSKQKTTHLLAGKNERIETLLQELQHRVKNNMQMISSLLNLQSRTLADSEARDVMQEGRHRIDAMSLIHQKLYMDDDISSINAKEYLEDLVLGLMKSFSAKGAPVDLKMKIDALTLPVDTAIPLGLITNELVTNALKYGLTAPQPVLQINLSQQNGKLRLEVNDNGKGIQQEKQRTNSLGMKLVAALAKQINSMLTITSEKGTSITLQQ